MNLQDHRQHIYLGEPDEDLIESLEPDQLVAATQTPFARKALSKPTLVGLWALRLFLLAITAMVIYAFIIGVLHPPHSIAP